jgi:endonuclease/exonuclease/phosphatase family metal-dependent hydrolase
MNARFRTIVAVLLFVPFVFAAQAPLLPIGAIQGATDVSPYLNRFVNFHGVVVGRYEDENTRGEVYYTLFVQDLPDAADGDPATSDAIAVFLGRQPRDDIPLGAPVAVGGKVTEFFGLTEIDDRGLVLSVEEQAVTMPQPVIIDPPADVTEAAAYFEALEGMRVAYDGAVVVAGPTHEGCGFAVTGEAAAAGLPAIRRANDDPVGRVVPVLYPSDRACDDIPQVKTGDRIAGLAGALTYNFDQFKIVFDSAEQLTVEAAEMPLVPSLPALGPEQIAIASLNAEDFFDTARDTAEAGEPVLTNEELAARRVKLAHVIAALLGCPTVVALQEVEHAALLDDLSTTLAEPCGFAYQVSHLESPDARGIDNALLSDPRRVDVTAVALRPTCSPVPTEVVDPAITCPPGEEPLFGRPPLQVEARIDGKPYTFFVNHFKSKRDGEIETGLERIRQAVYLNGLAAELLDADPQARLIALGDFNDTDLSPTLALLTDPAQGGLFTNALAAVPSPERYSYNFGGVVELIDAVLLSPALAAEVGWTMILHTNTDFPVDWRLDTSPERLPFRASDHDVPVVVLGQVAEPTATPVATPTARQPATIEPTREPTAMPTVTPTANDRPATAMPAADARPTADRQPPQPAATEASSNNSSFWLFWLLGGAIIAMVGIVWLRARR